MAPAPWFGLKAKAARKTARQSVDALPDGLWTKCPKCSEILFNRELEKNLRVCNKCSHHYRLTARERIDVSVDEGTFVEMDAGITSTDPLGFPDYDKQLVKFRNNSRLEDSIVTGTAMIEGLPVVIGVGDFSFWGGTMGGVAGEKVVRAMEYAVEKRLPVVMFIASGGIRVQEGLPGLMQMAKTSAACAKLREAQVAYVVVLTDPSMAGVLASHGSLGDFIISEPGLLTGLTADRVAAQAQVIHYPDNFRRAEFALDHGMIDIVAPRKEIRPTLAKLLRFSGSREGQNAA